jgi:hypothetical protein
MQGLAAIVADSRQAQAARFSNGRSRCSSPSCPLQYIHQSAERKKTRTKPRRSINEAKLRLRPDWSSNSIPGAFAPTEIPTAAASCIQVGTAPHTSPLGKAIASNAQCQERFRHHKEDAASCQKCYIRGRVFLTRPTEALLRKARLFGHRIGITPSTARCGDGRRNERKDFPQFVFP